MSKDTPNTVLAVLAVLASKFNVERSTIPNSIRAVAIFCGDVLQTSPLLLEV